MRWIENPEMSARSRDKGVKGTVTIGMWGGLAAITSTHTGASNARQVWSLLLWKLKEVHLMGQAGWGQWGGGGAWVEQGPFPTQPFSGQAAIFHKGLASSVGCLPSNQLQGEREQGSEDLWKHHFSPVGSPAHGHKEAGRCYQSVDQERWQDLQSSRWHLHALIVNHWLCWHLRSCDVF